MRMTKVIYRIFLVFCCLVCAFPVLALLNPLWAFAFSGLTKNIHALLVPSAPVEDLPQQVSITIDGSTATFCKGTPDYDRLIELLRVARSNAGLPPSAGPYPYGGNRLLCGTLTIQFCWIPFHFNVYRSTENRNYLWIKIPKMNGYGNSLPMIIDDGRLFRLIHDTGEQQHCQPMGAKQSWRNTKEIWHVGYT